MEVLKYTTIVGAVCSSVTGVFTESILHKASTQFLRRQRKTNRVKIGLLYLCSLYAVKIRRTSFVCTASFDRKVLVQGKYKSQKHSDKETFQQKIKRL